MRNLLRIIRHKIAFDQKREWDKLAYSHLRKCHLILDAGCGEGRFISQNPDKILGLDWNAESLNKCKEDRHHVVMGDIRSLPFQSEAIPGIHCSHVIEHFLPRDVHKFLSEFDRILAPGGMIVIRSPLLWDGFYSDLTHIRPYNPGVIISYLAGPGQQSTLKQISQSFQIIHLKWRYRPLLIRIGYLGHIFHVLSRWGFPWLHKNGYLLVMKKK